MSLSCTFLTKSSTLARAVSRSPPARAIAFAASLVGSSATGSRADTIGSSSSASTLILYAVDQMSLSWTSFTSSTTFARAVSRLPPACSRAFIASLVESKETGSRAETTGSISSARATTMTHSLLIEIPSFPSSPSIVAGFAGAGSLRADSSPRMVDEPASLRGVAAPSPEPVGALLGMNNGGGSLRADTSRRNESSPASLRVGSRSPTVSAPGGGSKRAER